MRWRDRTILAAVITVIMLSFLGGVEAGSHDNAYAAYNRGDYATAIRLWRPLAVQGDANAQYNFGVMYESGRGVRQDYAVAARWYRWAAEQGNASAQARLGVMYDNGRGVPQDYTEAVKWYRRAVEQGNARAQTNLGDMYFNGQGVPRNYAEALRWYRRAAQQGSADAQYNVGLMYYDGRGVPQDYAEALRWYRRAAEQGSAYAQTNLGDMYFNGQGVSQDYVTAHKWFNLSASRFPPGDYRDQAVKNRDTVARDMTASQIAEAQRLARAWQPRQRVVATSPSTVGPRTKYQSAQPDAEDTSDKRRRVARIQRRLASLGYDPGPVDGVLGRRTRAAIRKLQDREGLPVTGTISDDLEAALGSASRAVATAPSPASRPLAKASTGSGFYVSNQGHVLTNEHVVDECVEVRIAPSLVATVVARDQASDLALLRGRTGRVWGRTGRARAIAAFRQGRGIRPGDDIVVIGYPLPGLLASDAHVTTGTVSALAGPGDDRRFIQITAPVQPGNSGGPVLDTTGNIVGVVMAKLNAIKIARATGDIPQNVNFAIGAGTARAFLDAQSVPYEVAPSTDELKTADVFAEARRFTVLVECWN